MSTFTDKLSELGCQFRADFGLKADDKTNRKPLTATEVEAWWAAFKDKPITGWAQFSDSNVRIVNGKSIGSPPTGPLLAAEFYIEESAQVVTTHQLRPCGTGWTTTTLTRVSEPDTYLETRSFISDKGGKTHLTYEVAWKSLKQGEPARPFASRLIKIETV